MGYNDRGQVNYRITHTPPARCGSAQNSVYIDWNRPSPGPAPAPCPSRPLFMTVLFMCQLVSMSHNPPLHCPNWLFDYGLTYVCLSFRSSSRLRWGAEGWRGARLNQGFEGARPAIDRIVYVVTWLIDQLSLNWPCSAMGCGEVGGVLLLTLICGMYHM